ncbi:MAG: hypothetical protein R3B70_06320 [Polyangiaceae bacterium]
MRFGKATLRRHSFGAWTQDPEGHDSRADAAELAELRAICKQRGPVVAAEYAETPGGALPTVAQVPAVCAEPLALVLSPVGADGGILGATHLSVEPPPGEAWSMSVGGQDACALPCSRWVPPGKTATLARDGGGASVVFFSSGEGGERRAVVEYGKDGSYPALGAGLTGLGVALAAFGFGVLGTGEFGGGSPSDGSSIGSSGGVGGQLETLAGLAAMGALGVLVGGNGLYFLAKGPSLSARLRFVSTASARGEEARSEQRRAPSVHLTPSGVGLRF